jgi:hypothetical protein
VIVVPDKSVTATDIGHLTGAMLARAIVQAKVNVAAESGIYEADWAPGKVGRARPVSIAPTAFAALMPVGAGAGYGFPDVCTAPTLRVVPGVTGIER